jgi:hypothetical protein
VINKFEIFSILFQFTDVSLACLQLCTQMHNIFRDVQEQYIACNVLVTIGNILRFKIVAEQLTLESYYDETYSY